MSVAMERIRGLATREPRRLVLPEGEDERVARAAERLTREGLAEVTVLRGTTAQVDRRPGAAGGELEHATFGSLLRSRGDRLSEGEARSLAREPLFQAAELVRSGQADCFVGGAAHSTAEVLRAALWLIGLAPGLHLVSSFFLMIPAEAQAEGRALFFADCGVVPDPDSTELAEIACATADNFTRLMGEPARVAFLSFSTQGSAEHPRVGKVREAVARARALRPDLALEGELQVDAALDPMVARRKGVTGAVTGDANVLIFPDLDAGNIGYKLVQRLGGARAYGPILQGLARQVNDLSRGCSSEDVVQVATIACALAQGRPAHT